MRQDLEYGALLPWLCYLTKLRFYWCKCSQIHWFWTHQTGDHPGWTWLNQMEAFKRIRDWKDGKYMRFSRSKKLCCAEGQVAGLPLRSEGLSPPTTRIWTLSTARELGRGPQPSDESTAPADIVISAWWGHEQGTQLTQRSQTKLLTHR